MIPKKIHYCWFGGKPLPKNAIKCINSWKKFLPDYEIVEWNESNFDVDICDYTKEAYEAKKFAFVSDFARFWILYHHGGVYFDVDVEVIKPMEHIIETGPFMAAERVLNIQKNDYPMVAAGLGLAVYAYHPIFKEIIQYYYETPFLLEDGTINTVTVVKHVTDILKNKGLKPTSELQKVSDITIYPPDYFCPKSYVDNKLLITRNTVSIHHFDGSWIGLKERFRMFFRRLLR